MFALTINILTLLCVRIHPSATLPQGSVSPPPPSRTSRADPLQHPSFVLVRQHHLYQCVAPRVENMGDAPAKDNPALNNDMGDAGRDVVLSLTQGRILYWRNMILLFLSIVVGGRTLLAICRSWRHTQYNSIKRFANLLVGILLLIELMQSIVWLIGINIASAQDGVGPWKRISLERADRICHGDAVLDYWLDIMIFTWHGVMAFLIWEWIVRQKDMDLLTRRLCYLFPTCVVLTAAMTTVPVVHSNLGLWPHSDCFIRRSWKTSHEPMLGVLLDRMVILPLCWLVVVVLNCSTVHFLRKESLQQYGGVHSIMRLQMRLVLITTVFALVWILQSIPLYLDRRTFALELSTKWAFGIGFVDALIFGWPSSLTYIFGPCCLPLIKRLFSSFPRGANTREHQQEVQQAGGSRWQPGAELPRSISADWTTLVPSEYPTMYNNSSGSARSGAPAAVSGGFPGATRLPSAGGLTPYRIFATTFDMNYRNLPSGKPADDCDNTSHTSGGRWAFDTGSTFERDSALVRGLEAWIPAGGLYHLYVIAVQRCRVLTKLRQSIHDHLGGSGRYVLAGLTEIGDALYGKMALLVFARTVDVESGAFRLLASNQRPVVLRELRGGCKGMVGLSFRYYDTAFAAINAHLPATSVYPADTALEERDKHVSSMLQTLRIGGDHEHWDAHLQYHHVILMGNLNYRMRLGPHDMFARIQTSSKACQAAFESLRETAAQRGVGFTEWSWRGHGYNRLWSLADHQKQQDTRQGMTGTAGWDVDLEDLVGEDENLSTLSCPSEAWAWVKKKDVLSRRLQRGLLFSGFTEPSISFPPSFKWRVGAKADDYTEGAVLEAAYVTGPQSYLPEVDRGSSTTNTSAKWTPSYTDRILTRSLPAFASRLAVGAYDLCDHGPLTCISDHRAVAQALTVLIDTTYVLPKSEDLREKGRPASLVRKRDSSSTAQAMAAATTRRQSRADGSGGGAVPRPGPSSSSSSSKSFPLLMTLTLREFNFHLTGLEVTREEGEESVYGPLCPQDSMPDLRRSESNSVASTQAVVMGFPEEDEEESAQGGLGSSDEEDHEDEEKDENRTGDIEAPPPPPQPPLLPLSPLPPRPPLESGPTSTSAGGWRRIPSSFKLWRGVSLSRGVSQATSPISSIGGGDALGFVDHILVLYPLPAEDPLLPLRRAQALGDSFGQGASVQTRGTLLSGSRGRGSGTGVDRGASMGSSDCGSSSSSSGGTTTRKLENLHCIPWTRGLEYDANNLPFLRRDNSSSSSIFSPGTSSPSLAVVAAAASRIVGGTPLSSHGSSETKEGEGGTATRVNVLTMGPPRPCQHGLIKFMGKRGKELGQGVFHVELQEGSCGRGPLFGGAGGSCMLSERRRGRELVTRQTVELSVGGRYRGTVSFTLGVKARKRAEDGSSLRLPQ